MGTKQFQFTVRPMEIADIPAVQSLYRDLDAHHAEILPDVFQPVEGNMRTNESLAHWIGEDERTCVVAVVGGAVVGFMNALVRQQPSIAVFRPHRFVHIDDAVVKAEFRGKGIAKAMLEEIREWAVRKGIDELQLLVWNANIEAMKFYESRGFRPMTTRMGLKLSQPGYSKAEQRIPFNLTLEPNLSLRSFRIEDAEELFKVVDVNRDRLREWLPWVDSNTGVEDSRRFIHSALEQEARGNGVVCAVILSGCIVGSIGHHDFNSSKKSVHIGYWLSENEERRGIMTRCCRVLVEHAFSVLGLNRVEISPAVENIRSRRIPERLGFTFEGIRRNAEWLNDHYVDHAVYSLLQKEWNPNKKNPGIDKQDETENNRDFSETFRQHPKDATIDEEWKKEIKNKVFDYELS